MPSLAEVIGYLDACYPPATAEDWDAVGLTCGDPAAPIEQVVLAVDCVPATVAQTVAVGAQLLLTHHPLLLGGVHGVPADDPKGSMVHTMIRSGVAHFAAHTNADSARNGVSEALALRVGLSGLRPLLPELAQPLDHLSVLVPTEHLDPLIRALTEAGAGAIGNYDSCTFIVEGIGTFRPTAGADPFDGEIGVLRRKTEQRLSVVLPRPARNRVLAAMRAQHPYEEVAFELTEQPGLPADTGTGRVGVLDQAIPLGQFLAVVAERLPGTGWGIRAAGDPGQLVRTVAVCGGSGAPFTEAARAAGADVYLTSDLKHHSTIESVTERTGAGAAVPMALIDAGHWSTEAPWLPVLAGLLRHRFGDSLAVTVSDLVTDPWNLHLH